MIEFEDRTGPTAFSLESMRIVGMLVWVGHQYSDDPQIKNLIQLIGNAIIAGAHMDTDKAWSETIEMFLAEIRKKVNI